MKKKGSFEAVIESVQLDRVGFVSASIKKQYMHTELGDSMPGPDRDNLYGAVHTRTTMETENGVTTVRWLYEGIHESVAEAVYLYEFQGSMESVPIQAHPNYKSWLGVYGDEDTNGNWRPFRSLPQSASSGVNVFASLNGNSGGSAKGKKNPLLGAEAFLSIGGVWSRRYGVKEVPGDALAGVGLIQNTVPGTPPTIPANRNWLKGAPIIAWRGNAWDVTEQYLLSGVGGWVSIIYNGSTSSQ